MALKQVFTDTNISYNSALDANAKVSFIQIEDKHYLKVEGKDNSDVKVNFNRICSGVGNWEGSELRIPIEGKDDFIVKWNNQNLGEGNIGAGGTVTFNTGYDIGYGKGIYGPVLFGTDFWNSWPTSNKNVSAYFFKGDEGKVYLRVNTRSFKPQKVLIKIKTLNKSSAVDKIEIPTTAKNSVVPNTQSESNGNNFTFDNNGTGQDSYDTLLFEAIYNPKKDVNGSNYASGNVYGPLKFYYAGKTNTGYDTVEALNDAMSKKAGQKLLPVEWVIRKNGLELCVLDQAEYKKNSVQYEEFQLKIEDVIIAGNPLSSTKKGIIFNNFENLTENPGGILDTGNSPYFGVFDNGQKLLVEDSNSFNLNDQNFAIVVNNIDDNLLAKLDIYHFGEKSGNNNRRVVIGIHAGGWKGDQPKDAFVGVKPYFFRKRETIFVNIEYRVSPEPPDNIKGKFNGYDKNRVKFPAQIEDVAAAIKWVYDNISNYGGDPNKIILYGHGSGAHLASLVSTNGKWLGAQGLSPAIIKGCIISSNLAWNIKYELDNESTSLSGDIKTLIYNAFGIDPAVGGAEANLDFESTEKAKEAYDSYSPDLHLSPSIPNLLILTRGSNETIKRADDFVTKVASVVGVASTAIVGSGTTTTITASTKIAHFKYPGNKTYSQDSIQSILGISPDPDSNFILPKDTPSVSQAITGFFKTIPFEYPENAIIEYPEIDGQEYSAVSGISTEPLPVGFFGNPADVAKLKAKNEADKAAAAQAAQANNAANQIQLGAGGLFGAPGVDVVQVGYIDPVLGYVSGLSICEANEYAQENPGSTFIAVDGDNNINYLNINDVNKLTADFADSKSNCGGLKATLECGQPLLQIYGGGGIGAQGNLIIGKDGSVMAVDLIHKGFGYQYPPLVSAIDQCYFGNGATFEAVLGTVSDTTVSFDKDEDFEEYFVCPPGTSLSTLYDPSGKPIGKWDPSLYTNPSANPIANQVSIYENLINKIKNPWWTTRKKKPSKVTGTKSQSNSVYPVSHPCVTVDFEGNPVPLDSPKKVSENETVTFILNPDGTSSNKETVIKFTSTDKGGDSFTLKPNDNFKNTEIKVKVKKNVNYEFTVTETAGQYGGVETLEKVSKNKVSIGYKNSVGNKNDKNDLFLSSSFGEFSVDSKKKVGTFSLQSSNPKATNEGKQSAPKDVKPKFIKKDGKFYLDVKEYTGDVKLDFQFIINDTASGGKGLAANGIKIPGTEIIFKKLDLSENINIKNNLITKSFTVKGGKEYGPIEFIGGFAASGEFIKNDQEIYAADPVSYKQFLSGGVNAVKDKADFNIKIVGYPKLDLKDPENPTSSWGEFMNKYAISPVPPSNVPGSDYAATQFSLEWNELFPYDGDYIFRGCKDNTGKLYLDNEFLSDLDDFNKNPKEIKKFVKGGNHTIRIDLSNEPKKEVQALPVLLDFTIKGEASKNGSTLDNIFFTFTSEDGKDSFKFAAKEKNQDISKSSNKGLFWSRTEKVKIRPNVVYKVQAQENTLKYKGIEQGLFKTKKGDSQEIGEGTGNKIFADFLSSNNEDNDIQIIAKDGEFKAFNKKKTEDGSRNTYDLTFVYKKKISEASEKITNKIFDTLSYIDKSDIKLWKIDPIKVSDVESDIFINKYGVSPFDTSGKKGVITTTKDQTKIIQWADVSFPISGDYTIEVAADDNAKIFIGNKASGGKLNDGSGLKSITESGDEEIINVQGFSSGASKGKQSFTKNFKQGTYRIRVELSQVKGKKVNLSSSDENSMMVAIQIKTKVGGTSEVISKQSWCENPLGVALTIEAPAVPIPQEPAIEFEGCPPTPLWSTRQPKGDKIWYPVKYNGYKTFVEQLSKVPKQSKKVGDTQNIEFTVFGEGGKGDKTLKYLEFVFESADGKEKFVIDGVEPEKNKTSAQYKINKKVKKNVKYTVTARITDKTKVPYDEVEQGLSILKGANSDEASKSKKSGTVIFADYIGSPNDNDDIRVSISKGDGEFTIGKKSTIKGRTTYELFYELVATNVGKEQEVKLKPKFVKDKKDQKIYLDMTEFNGEFELDFKFLIADTVTGDKGIAATSFEIKGTDIKFNRYKDGKLIEDKDVKKSFKLTGGKKYGPVIFTGGDKGSSTQLISADQIASLDTKSTEFYNDNKKFKDKVDFNVLLTGVSGLEYEKPEEIEGWSKFLNRYAISPVPPLYASGTDGGGQKYENSWNVEFPYDGFYKFEGEADNTGKVFVDGSTVLDLSKDGNFASNKVFIAKGKHSVKVEVENSKTEVYDTIEKEIFSTKDKGQSTILFTVKANSKTKSGVSALDNIFFEFTSEDGKDTFKFVGKKEENVNSKIKPKFIKENGKIYLQVDGTGTSGINFTMDVNDSNVGGYAADKIEIPVEGSTIILNRTKVKEIVKGSGKIKAGKKYGPIKITGGINSVLGLSNPFAAFKQKVSSDKISIADNSGNDENIKVTFNLSGTDETSFTRVEEIPIRPNVTYKVKAYENSSKYKGIEQGLYVSKKGDSSEIGEGTGNKIFADFLDSANDDDDIQIIVEDGEFKAFNKKKTKNGRNTYDLTYTLKSKDNLTSDKEQVSYKGPLLINDYQNKKWSAFMNKYAAIPADKSLEDDKKYILKWSGVDFPEDGQYEYQFQGDNKAVFKLDGKSIETSEEFSINPKKKYFNASKGKHTIEIELTNTFTLLTSKATEYDDNPTATALLITKKIQKLASTGKSWIENPMGIGVAIIPPPCPKKVGGKGVVDKIIPINGGNGFQQPKEGGVPVALQLDGVIIQNPGINYNCAGDPIVITPDNGAVLSYTCDSFGKITNIKVEQPGIFTETPKIEIITTTGQNFSGTPTFTVIRDPIPIDPEKVIQVTDLVGLKQTGWVDGRPYYGAIFYKDGLKFAGYYETIGEPVQIYDTLEESVTGRITTPPSAIERSGTDVTNNDPRLDIPGTPRGLVE